MMDVSKVVINVAFTEATDHQSFIHRNKQLTANAKLKCLLSPSQQSMQIFFRYLHYNH